MKVYFADLNNKEVILQLRSHGPIRKGLPDLPVQIRVIFCFSMTHALYSQNKICSPEIT